MILPYLINNILLNIVLNDQRGNVPAKVNSTHRAHSIELYLLTFLRGLPNLVIGFPTTDI